VGVILTRSRNKIDVVYDLPDKQKVLKKLIDSPQNMTPYGLWYAGYFSSEIIRQTTPEGQFSAQELWFIKQICDLVQNGVLSIV
jgi:hypothetical protein